MDWALALALVKEYGPEAYALIKKIIENWKKPKLTTGEPCPLDVAIEKQIAALSSLLDLKACHEDCPKEKEA